VYPEKILWNVNMIILKESKNESSIILERTHNVDNRWMHLKTEEVLTDLSHINMLTGMIEERRWINMQRCRLLIESLTQIILVTKDSDTSNRIVEITKKYLSGMKRFLAELKQENIFFYKELLEGTVLAIIQEIGYLRLKWI
jgi:hypothetical protein